MEKLYPLKDLEKIKGKYEIECLMSMGRDFWQGELNNGCHVVIVCRKKIIRVKITETEIELYTNKEMYTVAKLNKLYDDLSFITKPPNNCQIKYVLNMLEWKYNDDDIWC